MVSKTRAKHPMRRSKAFASRISILGFFSPRILLRDLEVIKPRVPPHRLSRRIDESAASATSAEHLNKPAMRYAVRSPGGHIAGGTRQLQYRRSCRGLRLSGPLSSARISSQRCLGVMKYVPAAGNNPESYHLETGVTRPEPAARGQARPRHSAVACLRCRLRSTLPGCGLSSLPADHCEHRAASTGTGSGCFRDASPISRIRAGRQGPRAISTCALLNPILGFPSLPKAWRTLNLDRRRRCGEFPHRWSDPRGRGAYVGPAIACRNLRVDTRVHVDADTMQFGNTVVRFAPGGSDGGRSCWSTGRRIPGRPHSQPRNAPAAPAEPKAPSRRRHFWNRRKKTPPLLLRPILRHVVVKDPVNVITVHGKITRKLEGVALDTILDIVGKPAVQPAGG